MKTPKQVDIEDEDSLFTYLAERGLAVETHDCHMELLTGGVSNKTVRVQIGDFEMVIKQALSELRVSTKWKCDPGRIHREALGMEWLSTIFPDQVPKLLFHDRPNHLLAMEAVPLPHDNLKHLLMSGHARPEYFEQSGKMLAKIHSLGGHLTTSSKSQFSDQRFFIALRLEPYYEVTGRELPATKPFYDALIRSCRRDSYTIVHGDFSPKNLLVREDRLILLDHEVLHFGDGTFDVGFALSHLLSKYHHVVESRPEFRQGALLFSQNYLVHLEIELSRQRLSRIIDHTIACLLARVHGQSPLEYLSRSEKYRQTACAFHLLKNRPGTMEELIESFCHKI